MSILTWIEDKKRLKVLNAPKHSIGSTDSSKGLWTRCDKCGVILYIKHLKENQRVCFSCSYHLQMMSGERIENLLDKSSANAFPLSKRGSKANPLSFPGEVRSIGEKERGFCEAKLKKASNVSTWRPLDETVSPCDPLKFHDQKAYTDRLQDAQERTGLQDAIQTGTGMIDGIPVALAVMDFSFMGGSMGSVVGEKLTRLIEYATGEGLTLLIVSASGGARMQEGVFSLMQMAKISSALQIYQSCAKLLYISILTSPTTGGVTASFAMLGDIIFAEPKALIAFAGRRVIEQTLCEDLPDDFQTSEYMLHHGLVDLIVPRRFLRQALSETIRLYQNAPFKKRGHIPFGVQNPITFLTEEKIRRGWGGLTSSSSYNMKGSKAISYKQYNSSALKRNQSTKKVGGSKPLFSQSDALNLNSSTYNLFSQKELKRNSITRLSKNSSEGFAKQNFKSEPTKGIYREILTSFEIMLALFLSGNSKRQNQASVRLQKSINSSFSRNFLSGRLKSPFWLYNNLIVRTSITFDNKNFSGNHFKVKTSPPFTESDRFILPYNSTFVTQKQIVLGQSRKNQPLYSILKSDFARYTCRTKVIGSLNSVPAKDKEGGVTAKKKDRVSLQNTGFVLKNENGAVPTVERVAQKREVLFTQKSGLFLSKSKEDWSFSKLLRVAFKNRCFFNFSLKDCKALASKRFFISMVTKLRFVTSSSKVATTYKSLRKKRYDLQKSKDIQSNYKSSYKYNQTHHNRFYVRLKRSFVLQVIFDYGFYCTSVTDLLKNTHNKHIFAGQPTKRQPLRDFSTNEKQTSLSSSFLQSEAKPCKNIFKKSNKYLPKRGYKAFFKSSYKSESRTCSSPSLTCFRADFTKVALPSKKASFTSKFYSACPSYKSDSRTCKAVISSPSKSKISFGKTNRSLYPEKKQNRAALNGEIPNSPLLYNFRYLAEAMLKSNRLQTSDMRKSPGFKKPGSLEPSQGRSEQMQSFDSTQNKVNTVANLNGTVFNRSAIGLKHTKYLRERALYFLQNPNEVENQNQSPVTQKVSAISALSSDKNKNQKEITLKKVSATDFASVENDIDFLNQAIELAATESVEWRAFYIHQQFSENKGFLDDFLQSEGDEVLRVSNNSMQEQTSLSTDLKPIFRPFLTQPSDSVNQVGNVLFYKSICR